jgi:hypothetical protein
MDFEPRSAMLRALSHLFPENSDSVAIAGGFVRVLQDIRIVLTPILGERGVAALLQRSLHRARLEFPWLADSPASEASLDLEALQDSLSDQDPASARAAVDGALHAFHALLSSLIGAPLTERLFDSVWAPPSSGNAAQESPS